MPVVDRDVYVTLPGNAWFLLLHLDQPDCPKHGQENWCMRLTKAMYGLNDGPYLWQMCLRYFYVYHCGGRCSVFDENHFVWRTDKALLGEATAHVDDNNIAGPLEFRNWLREQLEARFGKVGRQELPMVHVGIVYERFLDGFRMHQRSYAEALKNIDIG